MDSQHRLSVVCLTLLTALQSNAWADGWQKRRPCPETILVVPEEHPVTIVQPRPVPVETPAPATKPEPERAATPDPADTSRPIEPSAPQTPAPTVEAVPEPTGIPDYFNPETVGSEGFGMGDSVALFESNVGYIDAALPLTRLRLRYDSAYNNFQPTRAEFLWAWPPPFGPGLAIPERKIDDQQVMVYGEFAPTKRMSAFVEMGAVFLNPDFNPNFSGLGDMTAGFKYAFIYQDDFVATFQLRNFIPTGYSQHGLGTGHYSIEPALLLYRKWGDRLVTEGEFRCWIPIGGTPGRAGEVLRYGLGAGYTVFQRCDFRIIPIAELVGWTVLNGRKQEVQTPTDFVSVDAAGDTIVNLKLGTRFWLNRHNDIYVGYGRALTGNAWYEEILRAEYRITF